uniref:EGF-like domain-containing protein n=1 Tax=Ciona intestinalis TaxID=7719 RepID=F6XU75_CIOIN
MRADGSEKRAVLTRLNWPYGVFISYERNSLFFTEARMGEILEYSLDSMNQSSPQHVNVFAVNSNLARSRPFFISMVVLGDMVYFYDLAKHYVEQFNLTMGVTPTTQFGPTIFFKGREMMLYNRDYYNRYIGPLSNPCGRNTSNACSEFCFNINNQTVCNCQDGSSLLGSVCVDNVGRTDNPPRTVEPCPVDTEIQLPLCESTVPFSWNQISWVDDYTR